MNSNSSAAQIFGWVSLLVLTVASLSFGYLRLDGLPDLGVRFGPDLGVRAVPVDREGDAEREDFRRGDKLVALQGQSVADLRELRTVLQNLPTAISQPDQGKLDAQGDPIENIPSDALQLTPPRKVSYQLVRPLHRFPIALQGKPQDPTALPPGVEAADRLVELDGRKLQSKVGPEGVRSIVASRPEALLVFERQNAVFSGVSDIPQPRAPYGVVGIFAAVLLVLGGLRWFRAKDLEPASSLAIGFETLCFGWIALLAYEYQWVLSDDGLVALTLVAFSLARPSAFFARHIGSGRGTQAGWSALLLGLGAAGSMIGLYLGGYMADAEQALQVAALLAGLFVVYEIFVASIEGDAPGSSLGEGSGYIAWILVLGLFSALIAWYLVPIAFEEDRWRWFATAILGMVWFADLLFCLRGVRLDGWAQIAQKADREGVLLEYLDAAKLLVPQARSFLVAFKEGESYIFESEVGGLKARPSSESLHDAMAILVQERARIPLSELIDAKTHPMGGIANTMGMLLALPLAAPAGAIEVDNLEIILVGLSADRSKDAAEEGGAPKVAVETLDILQELLNPEMWAAMVIEALLVMHGPADPRLGAQPAAQRGQASRALLAERRRAKELSEEVQRLRERLEEGGPRPAEAPAKSQQRDLSDTPEETAPPAEPQRVEEAEHIAQEDGRAARINLEVERPKEAKAAPQTSSGARIASVIRAEAQAEPEGASARFEAPSAAPKDPPPVPDLFALDPLPAQELHLLEPELVDALDYLLETDEAVVLGGAPGVGKTFIVRAAHALDEIKTGALFALNAAQLDEPLKEPAGVFQRLIAQAHQQEAGALLVQNAQELSGDALRALLEQWESSVSAQLRLYLSFEDEDAPESSVLTQFGEEIYQKLESRELVIPELAERPTILRPVIDHFLSQCAKELGLDASADPETGEPQSPHQFSIHALETLLEYPYPGQFAQVREIVCAALKSATQASPPRTVIGPDDLDLSE